MFRHAAPLLLLASLTVSPAALCADSLVPKPDLTVALTVGSLFASAPNGSDVNTGPVRTDIDLTAPANATGSVTSAHVYWSSSPCTNAIKIKFFQRVGNTLTLVAERGPFTSTAGDNTFALSPAVAVSQGYLIGVARVAACGNPGVFAGFPTAGYVSYGSDVSGSVDLAGGTTSLNQLAVSATGSASELRVGIIPVVGSTGGSGGSNFKTSLQLLYGAPGSTGSVEGKLVFHPAGSTSASDPIITYFVTANQTIFYPDILQGFNRTGLGSIDVITAPGATKPVFIIRVFNDAGTAGSSGLTEDVVQEPNDDRILYSGFTGFLVAPIEPSKTRFNIGVRTMDSGATFTAILRDKNGSIKKSVTKSYLPNWFEQVDSTTFFGGTALDPNDSIAITVSSGNVIVYGSTTDNISNDPNIQFARALFGIA